MLINNKTTLLAGVAFFLQLGATSSYAAEASLVATANSNIVVNTTAQATISLEPKTTILAGKYGTNIALADWNAEATAGSLAFRLNPTIMKTTNSFTGTATSKESSTNTIPISMGILGSSSCNAPATTLIGGWTVCNQGLLSTRGSLMLNGGGTIAPGTYPLSVDVAVWAY